MYAVYRKTLLLSIEALQDADAPIHKRCNPWILSELWAVSILSTRSGVALLSSSSPSTSCGSRLVSPCRHDHHTGMLVCLHPLMTKDASAHQAQWSKLTDERTTLTTAAIKAIKAVKQSALEGFLIDKITSIRQREIKALVAYVYDILFISLLGNVAGDILLLATICTFALVSPTPSQHRLVPFTTSAVFTTITIIRIIERPLFIIGRRYASVISAITSLKRLETFLLLPNKIAGESDAAWSPPTEKVHLIASTAAIFDGVSLAWKKDVTDSLKDAASSPNPTILKAQRRGSLS